MTIQTVILSPHVDDEVLGCFAFLDEGSHVAYGGVEGRPSADVRLAELHASAEALGFSHEDLNQPVNRYESTELIGLFEKVIDDHQPDTVLIPAPSYNQDHRAFYEAAMVATRPHDTNHRVDRVLIYEQPHSVMWPLSDTSPGMIPNVFVAIDIDAKITAYERYVSQVRGHRSPEVVRALATLRGAQIGESAAEGFALRRHVIS